MNTEYDYNAYHSEITKIKNAEDVHFWFKIRNEIILSLFEKYIDPKSSGIEIGAGTGSIARMLTEHGYNMSVGEPHPVGMKFAKENGIKKVYRLNILTPDLKNKFDMVGLFDVLEHIDDHQAALRNINALLNDKGRLVISVPAHMWLWCKDDEVSKHYRRYELDDLKELLLQCGFSVLFARNYFLALLPLLYIRAKLRLYDDEYKINPFINKFLLFVSRIEKSLTERMHLHPSIGGTIFVVAQKRQ